MGTSGQSFERETEFARRWTYATRVVGTDNHVFQSTFNGPTYETQRRAASPRAFSDTSKKESAIKAFSVSDDYNLLKLWLSLAEEQVVDIAVYNILGKKVKDLDHTTFSEGEMKEAVYTIRDLPNGVYIVAAQGSNFRSAIRIVISR
jgi:hypothetical protein